MNKNRLNIERDKIDQIDKKIFNLVKKRTFIIKKMIILKKYKKNIIDQRRINEILKTIKKKSIKHGVDPEITEKIWKAMISSYISFQKKNFKKK